MFGRKAAVDCKDYWIDEGGSANGFPIKVFSNADQNRTH
jgi:hypothetical protein